MRNIIATSAMVAALLRCMRGNFNTERDDPDIPWPCMMAGHCAQGCVLKMCSGARFTSLLRLGWTVFSLWTEFNRDLHFARYCLACRCGRLETPALYRLHGGAIQGA